MKKLIAIVLFTTASQSNATPASSGWSAEVTTSAAMGYCFAASRSKPKCVLHMQGNEIRLVETIKYRILYAPEVRKLNLGYPLVNENYMHKNY